jgi:hypothetical protein
MPLMFRTFGGTTVHMTVIAVGSGMLTLAVLRVSARNSNPQSHDQGVAGLNTNTPIKEKTLRRKRKGFFFLSLPARDY